MSRLRTNLTIDIDGLEVRADAAAAIDISIPLDFEGAQPSFFGAPRAAATRLTAGAWVGDTRRGGSCNVGVYSFTPHCNGTHVESVGHIVNDAVSVADVVRGGLIPATLVTVDPVLRGDTRETTQPAPRADSRMVTALALQDALAAFPEARMRKALVIRTLPNPDEKAVQTYHVGDPPPFLTMDAARLLVDMGTEHVLVDTPSLDRMDDGGDLAAHHVFFGLPAGARSARAATRARCSVTEMIYVPDAVPDGYYLLDLQVPPFRTDAAPCRPLLYQVQLP